VEKGKHAWTGVLVVDLLRVAEAWCDHLVAHDRELGAVFRGWIARAVRELSDAQTVPPPRTADLAAD
jgi:hypothetical protein